MKPCFTHFATTMITTCLLAMATSASAQDPIKDTVDDWVDGVATTLVPGMFADSAEQNFALSPVATAQVVSALASIANGKTADQLYKLMGVDPSTANAPDFAKLNAHLERSFGKNFLKTYSAVLAKSMLKSKPKKTLETQYGMAVEVTDFGPADIRRVNGRIEEVTEFKDVLKSDPRQVMIAVNASNVTALWENKMSETSMTFNGVANVPALKGKISSYLPFTANNSWDGYEVPMENAKAFFIVADSAQDLKKLASDIHENGLHMRGADSDRTGPATLIVPEVSFENEKINYRAFAESKGLKLPFGMGADFSKGFESGKEIFCSDLFTKSKFSISKSGINLKQVTVAALMMKGIMIAPDDEANKLVIDKPFMVLITDEKYGCATIMAFVSRVR